VQAFRVGAHVYATQFHPELDAGGMATRVDVYKHAGYFDPSEADTIKALAWKSQISHPPEILRAFVRRYGRDRVGSATG
jgi:GMP synthase (glutamine-hydrolysing)